MKRLLIGATSLMGLLAISVNALAAPTICLTEAWRPSEDHGDGNLPKYVYVSNQFDATWRASTDSLEMASRFGGAVGGRYGRDANGNPDLNIVAPRCYQGDLNSAEEAFIDGVRSPANFGSGPTQVIQVSWP
jgi:hypothetical protein